MKSRKSKKLIAVIATAVIAVICTLCVIMSGTRTTNSGDFKGSYNLNAYAAVNTGKINVAGKPVDVVNTMSLVSNDGEYTLYITVIDTADLEGLNVHLSYGFGDGLYFTGLENAGFSNVVYSSLSSGEGDNLSTLSVSDFNLPEDTFKKPYFAIVEVKNSSILNKIGSLIVAERHNLEKVESQASTCTADGYEAYYKCTDNGCTKYFSDKFGLHEIADLEEWKADDGKLAAMGHTEVTDAAKAATCTESGLTEGKHCSTCGEVFVAQTVVEAKGHSSVTDAAKAATCTESGLTEGSHCSTCGEVFVAQTVVEAKGHTEVTDAAKAATCTESGLTEGSHCSTCGEVLVAQSVVEAKGHSSVTDAAKAATCTESGLTEGSHCSTCGEVLVAQSVVEAKGHTYLDGYEDEYCTVCHDHKTVVKEVKGVNYTLNYNIKAETGAISRYFIASGKASNFNSLYTGEGARVLNLENTIDDISVTEIAASAFANTADEESTAIKNVIVPANIETVGEKAFQNNYGIESVVFLAESVHLNGSGGNANSTYPFYGCSTYKSDDKVNGKKGNEITKLNIYYYSITAKNSSDWKLFRYVYNGWWYSFYIQDEGGALYTSGWDCATAVVNIDLTGVTDSTITEEKVNNILNKYYPVATSSAFTINAEIEASLKDDFAQFDISGDGKAYKCIWKTESDKESGYTVVSYNISFSSAKSINVYSSVGFTYYNTAVTANQVTPVAVDLYEFNNGLTAPVLTKYTFLGFASLDGTALTFGDGNKIANADATLYIIWGHSKAGNSVDITSTTALGTELPETTSGDGNWYDDAWNVVTSISTSNTVVYTRSVFTFTYKVSGSVPTKFTDSLSGQSHSGYSLTASFTVLEGQRVTGERSSNKKSMTLYLDGVQKTVLTVGTIYTFKASSYDSGIISSADKASVTFKY